MHPLAATALDPITYGEPDGYPLTLTLWLPPDRRDTPTPAVLLLHGGGWTWGISGPEDMALPAQRFADAGFVAATIAYRRTGEPGHTWHWPDPFRDAQRAVRWLRTNAGRLGIDPEAIVSYGHSAGGHLAALLAVRDDASDPGAPSSRVNGCIAIAGHMDLHIPYDDAFARSSMNALLGGDPDAVPDRATDASPIAWVDAASSPFLLLHGAADHQVTPRHHQTMATALQAAGVAVTVVTVPAADHFTIAAWECAGPWALAFVDTVAAHATSQPPTKDAP